MKYNKLSCANWEAASYLMSAAPPQTLPNCRQLSYHTCSKRIRPLAASRYPPTPPNSPELSSTLVPHVQHTHPTSPHQPQPSYPLKLSRTLVPHPASLFPYLLTPRPDHYGSVHCKFKQTGLSCTIKRRRASGPYGPLSRAAVACESRLSSTGLSDCEPAALIEPADIER